MADALDYERRGRVTLIEQLLRHVDGALFTVRNMLGIDPDGEGVPDATETVKGKDRLATVAEAVAGVLPTTIVTPAGLAAAIAALTPLFADSYVLIGAISTTNAPAISVTEFVNTFPATTITPAHAGSDGVWTLTANVAGTYAATSLVLCNRTWSQGTVEVGYVRTSDTILTITTRSVAGSAINSNLDNIPLIVITPKP